MNTILSSDRVEIPPLIRKGDVVQLVAESPSLKVVTRGMAKEKGGLGDRIRVENLSSKKSVYARIVDASTVRVEL
jgi:flagella basal body P-ring formation protein FlgA